MDLRQQQELAYEFVSDQRDTAKRIRKWLVNFNTGKTEHVLFDSPVTLVVLIWKWMDLSLMKNHLLRCWDCLSLLNALTFLSCEAAFFVYKSTIQPCIVYCRQVWDGTPNCYLDLLGKLQKWVCRTVGLKLTASLEPLGYRQNEASISLFYMPYFGRCSSELA